MQVPTVLSAPRLTPYFFFSSFPPCFFFPKLTGRVAIRAYVDLPGHGPVRWRQTIPARGRKKKQLKVPNRLLTCHKTKQVLHIKLWVFILLSTSSSHPFHYVSRGVFAAENVTWVSIKQKQKKILRRAKTNGRIKRNPLKKIR